MAITRIHINEASNIPKNFNPYCILRKFSEDTREPFNDRFFIRRDEDLVKEVEKVILSWQREHGFILRVLNFTLVEDPAEIEKLVYENEMEKNKGKIDPSLEYINLKETNTMLLIVHYYIEIFSNTGANKDKKTKDTMKVLILLPRIVDQYFYKIDGIMYNTCYQIVDGSIYNNSDKENPKSELVAFKTGRPIRIIRHLDKQMKCYDGEPILCCVIYTSLVDGKPSYAMRYIFAKMGLNDGLAFMNIRNNIFILREKDLPEDKEKYYILNPANDIFLAVPRMIFDNDLIVQSAIGTICKSISPTATYESIFTVDYWLSVLSGSYQAKVDLAAARSDLTNIETFYDIKTRELLHLPIEDKATIYNILFWIMKEFPELRARDNTDMYYKRLKDPSEYVALLFASKLSTAVMELSKMRKNNLTIDNIKKRIYTKPTIILQFIKKDSLINMNNRVNDNDAFIALKASYKGVSGIGEKSKKSIADRYRNVTVSQAGVVDMTASSATDPGMTTLLCPMGDLQEDGYFYSYNEPNGWENAYDKLLSDYYNLHSMKQAIEVEDGLTNRNSYLEKHMVIESMEIIKKMIEPYRGTLHDAIRVFNVDMEESGLITYEFEE